MEYSISLSGRSPLWFRFRYFWTRTPILHYQEYSRWKHPECTIFHDTELLIEGYGRSGSSYTGDCFRITNSFNLKLALNQKSPAAVKEASRWNVPMLMIVREPKPVALSYKTMNPNLPIDLILKCYSDYYKAVWKYRDHFVTATNVQIWDEFEKVAGRINKRFGTSFVTDLDSVKLQQKVIEYQDSKYDKEFGKNWSDSVKRTVNYPTEDKKKMRKVIETEYDSPRHRKLDEMANDWFRRFEGLANS